MENNFKGQALNVRVIVKTIEVDNINTQGLDVSSAVEKNGYQKAGVVVSVGELTPKLEDGTYTLKIGDKVLYDKTRNTPLTIDGINYAMLNYTDLFVML